MTLLYLQQRGATAWYLLFVLFCGMHFFCAAEVHWIASGSQDLECAANTKEFMTGVQVVTK